jgi:hypothetical protein
VAGVGLMEAGATGVEASTVGSADRRMNTPIPQRRRPRSVQFYVRPRPRTSQMGEVPRFRPSCTEP